MGEGGEQNLVDSQIDEFDQQMMDEASINMVDDNHQQYSRGFNH
jgi:hypothetical protein